MSPFREIAKSTVFLVEHGNSGAPRLPIVSIVRFDPWVQIRSSLGLQFPLSEPSYPLGPRCDVKLVSAHAKFRARNRRREVERCCSHIVVPHFALSHITCCCWPPLIVRLARVSSSTYEHQARTTRYQVVCGFGSTGDWHVLEHVTRMHQVGGLWALIWPSNLR